MKLISLKLENFRQHAATKIEFPTGITVINGTNGSGKSTILEAISWAIYGTEATRGNKSSIVWNKAPKNKVRAELVFEQDNNIFKVIRELNKAEVYLNDNDSPVATSQDEVTKYVSTNLGMSKNEFFNTYFTGQKELQFLGGQKAMERRKFISKVLGFNKVRNAQELAREDKNKLNNEIIENKKVLVDFEGLDNEKTLATEELKNCEKTLSQKKEVFNECSLDVAKIEPAWEKIKSEKEKYENFSKELDFSSEKNEYLQKNILNLSQQVKTIEEKTKALKTLKDVENKYKDVDSEIKKQEDLQEKESLRQKFLTQIDNLQKEIKEKDLLLAEIIETGKEKRKIVDSIPALKDTIDKLAIQLKNEETKWTSSINENKFSTKQKEQELSKVKKELEVIKKSGKDGVCPTCKRALKNEYEEVTSNFQKTINSIQDEIEKLNTELETISLQPEIIENLNKQKEEKEHKFIELNKFQGQYQEERNRYKVVKDELENKKIELEKIKDSNLKLPQNFDIEKLKSLREEIIKLRDSYEKMLSLKAELSNAENIKNNLEESENELKQLIEKQKQIEINLKDIKYSAENFAKIENEYKQIKENFYNQKEQIIIAESQFKNAEERLKRVQDSEKKLKDKLKIINKKQETLNHLIELDRFYGELWERLNNNARPEISELASQYLRELTDGRYSTLELNEKYEICLYDDGEIKPVISGGEEDVSNLCVRLAVSKIIAQRTGKTLSLLVLDEVFGSLDEDRRNNVLTLLNNLTNSFEQIILITHIEDIKDVLNNVITVEYDDEKAHSIIKTLDVTNSYKY